MRTHSLSWIRVVFREQALSDVDIDLHKNFCGEIELMYLVGFCSASCIASNQNIDH